MNNFLDLADFSREDIQFIIGQALLMKEAQISGNATDLLPERTLTMIFEKPSNRTRLSFDVGMAQLGGRSFYVKGDEVGLDTRESVEDVARVVSRYSDFIMLRTFSHETLLRFAKAATVPVINGLTDKAHPCQAMTDLMTIVENKSVDQTLNVVFVGDGNNVCESLIEVMDKIGIQVTVACPKGYEPVMHLDKANIEHDVMKAVKNADVIYTDVWVSMGQEEEREARLEAFKPYQVNMDVLKAAKDDVIFMHCLPAERGFEVTDEVMESKHSVVFDQAENRMHAQKAILTYLGGETYE